MKMWRLTHRSGNLMLMNQWSRKSILLSLVAGLPVSQSLQAVAAGSAAPETIIWLNSPASNFTESSPMGNGRLGAMLFGGVDVERIVLNESSVWSGSRQDADRPEAYKVLPEIRRLLLEGKNVEAEELVNANFVCKGPGSAGGQYGCYQVLGNLRLKFQPNVTNATVSGYRRELNLNDAVTRMQFTRAGIAFKREMFVSAPDQAMVLRLSADQPGQISFTASLDRPERFGTEADGDRGLLMRGRLDNGVDGKGLCYAARVRVLNVGGEVRAHRNILEVSKANEAILLVTAATDHEGFTGKQTKDPAESALRDLNHAADKSFHELQRTHIADYQRYFRRVSWQLGPDDPAVTGKATPERLQAFKSGAPDPALSALYFNFGRYLLISASRPGGLPANLQGIWAEEINTPWTGDWHLDVNVQMNYWPAEICNLSELHQPLFDLIASLQGPGARTAKAYYGARGWVAHVITNPWGFTSPGEAASWGAATSGSAWLCEHLWDHWLFTRDLKFLRWAYPILNGSARFYADMLIEEPKHHWLVVAPANSPENHFQMDDGRQAAICMGPTILQQLVRYLFTATIESSRILGKDPDFRDELVTTRSKLAPTQIGSDGRIMEWLQEYREPEPHHRHVSHLWGLFPGDEISDDTPELSVAARRSLEARGDEGVGWSLAYKAALWARLQDGERAYALVRKALSPTTDLGTRYDGGGGVYPNLFDASPPFQIDGNFGVTAAIAEMLLQSQTGRIELLAALPAEWPEGSVTGLRARGGIKVDISWSHGRLTSVVLWPSQNGACRLRYHGKAVKVKIKKGRGLALNAELETKP